MTYDFDRSVGQVLAKVKSLELEKKTWIIFMSDNAAGTKGTPRQNFPFAQAKASLYEGASVSL